MVYGDAVLHERVTVRAGIYILAIPPRGGGFLSKLKNREEFEGGHEKRKGKEWKEEKIEKSDKTHVKIPL